MSSDVADRDAPGLRVIEPKLMPPRVHPRTLRRGRLLELLGNGGEASLTVLSAAVGYGKTSLARSWCTERPEPVIWLTLDAADDDPVRLWTHLATAVERLDPGLGSPALSCLALPGVAVENAVDDVMNGLLAYQRPVTIVLDDLHAVKSESAVRSIAHAVERLPSNVRLIATTRSDPNIGLARLRARRALIEVRARDLAFTAQETRELMLREDIDLSRESVELLTERTEGWPAGLYLAALWLRELDDPDRRVREFAGSARQVGDYLSAEVLTALPPETRDFVLRTSVLDRFTPALCDAVLGREDSAAVLAELTRSNMFLVALDARGEWYRYHHLFGEVLALELGPQAALELRRSAAAWCGAHGLVEDAIGYAAAAADATMVADLLVEHHLEFVWSGRFGQFLGWMNWLAPELLAQQPVLPAAGAQASLLLGRPEFETRRLIAIADRARLQRPELWSPYVEAAVEISRAAMIQGGDVGRAVERGRRAVATARASADVIAVGALAALAQALFFAGDLDETREIALEAVEHPDAANRPLGYLAGLGLLALVDAELGRVESAEAWAREALTYARRRFQTDSWVVGLARLGLALTCAATGRLDEAEREAVRGEQLRRAAQPTVGHAHALLVLAQVRLARSRLARAADDLEQAQRAIAELPDPGRLPAIAASVGRELAEARANAGSRGPIEAPSPAELAVLRGLAAGLSRREIGQQLYISLNTVKSHARELYRKLGVSSQAEAVASAETLGLLDGHESPG
jgi:LuxR family transcriptional regulator, maltose regulon positive regulatory protein